MPLPNIPTGIETGANATMEEWKVLLAVKQAEFFAIHGRFFQCIVSGPAPTNGNVHVPDGSKRPTDQAESADDIGLTFPTNPKIAMGCDVYYGTLGHGYIPFGIISIAGQEWRAQDDVGPEDRAYEWMVIDNG